MPGSLGGNDIWKVAISDDGNFGIPENLGKSVNTEGNESFPFIADDNKLYFSSDGRKGFGALDIFVMDLNRNTEATNVGAPVNTEKDDFAFSFNTSKNIGFFSSNRAGADNIYMVTPVCGVEVITLVKDAKTDKMLAGAKVSVLDEKKNTIEFKITASSGEAFYKVDCNKPYFIQVTRDGYEGKTIEVEKTNGGTVNVVADLQPIDVIVKETEITLNEIFFEFDKNNITKEGAFELDKLVQVLKNNPTMEIMVKSHTDSRGSDEYNLNLSDRRAKATVQYVISKGVEKARITGKGYGESEPKMNCKENCTEEDYAKNRRSEFLIVKK